MTAKTINGEIERAILADLILAINPVRFAQSLGIDPDPWQRELLLSTEKRIILNCSRQSGKSTITAIIALHHALYNSGALVLLISRGYRQSTELFKKIAGFYQERGRPVPSDAENKHTLELVNKSRIVSLPSKGQTIRGFSGPSLIVIDEAAQIEDDELYYAAVRPMLAVSQGRLILLSTPFGKRGFFNAAWEDFENKGNVAGWQGIKITADQCPRITVNT
jgi:phage terminase large subunit-like protein